MGTATKVLFNLVFSYSALGVGVWWGLDISECMVENHWKKATKDVI